MTSTPPAARRRGRAWMLAALGLLPLAACARKPPNVLLISVDSLRADHLGCYGYPRDTSPAVDRLAAEGVLFQNHISSSSWTLPAHAALFTSLPDSVHGCTDTQFSLADPALTLAERFLAAGYSTGGFFSGPYLHPAFGLGQGFEEYEDCTSYAGLMTGRPPVAWADDSDLNQAAHRDVTGPRVFEAIERWMERRSDRPFFLFVHLWDVHFDFIPPPPFDTKYDPDYRGKITGAGFLFDPRIRAGMDPRDLEHQIALYDGEIAWTDTIIDRIRGLLEREGLLDDTVVALTADHGTEFFEHGGKAHRRTLYDEVVRVPLVVRYPRRLPAGLAIRAQSSCVDVGPTLAELAGLRGFDDVYGTSLLRLVADPRDASVPRAISELASDGRNLRSVRTLGWKVVQDVPSRKSKLFDLELDPGERQPRADFEGPLWTLAKAGYQAEIQNLEAFARAHPLPAVGAAAASVPLEVLDQLRKFGYVGGDESEGHDPSRPSGR